MACLTGKKASNFGCERLTKATFFFFIFIVLLVLSGCAKKECRADSDCAVKEAFKTACIQYKCINTPIPGVCGNLECNEKQGENCESCPTDCKCSGVVENSKFLQKQCYKAVCLEDILASKLKIQSPTDSVTSAGNRFRLTSLFNLPFNTRKELFTVMIMLDEAASPPIKITRIELVATKDRQTVVLGAKEVNKYLWAAGSEIKEEIKLDFPATGVEGSFKSPELKVSYEHGKEQAKKSTFNYKYKLDTFEWARPSKPYPCNPKDCDDSNPATKDYCGEDGFCVHQPIANSCGNFVCESTENKCVCEKDCGPCRGSSSKYIEYACHQSKCLTQLKESFVQEQKSVFDDRNIGDFHLQNYYHFNSPLNAKADSIRVEIGLYNKKQNVESIKISKIQLMDKSAEIGAVTVNQYLRTVGSKISVKLPVNIQEGESERSLSVTVWYGYDLLTAGKPEAVKKSFTETLGKITLLSPEVIK